MAASATINATGTDLITDLGTLGGATSDAAMVDAVQAVVGQAATTAGANHAYLYLKGGAMQDLGTLGGTNSSAHAIDSSAQVVVGDSETTPNSTIAHPTRWAAADGWSPEDLGTLEQGNGGGGLAWGVNSSGVIVGDASISGTVTHAFEYSGGHMADLGTLSDKPGAPSSQSATETSTAKAINDQGEIVGSSEGGGFYEHAFLIPAGGRLGDMQDINPPGSVASEADAINAAGDIALTGYDTNGLAGAYLLQGATYTNLGSLAGGDTLPGSGESASAGAINGRDEVVGGSAVSGAAGDGYHAFVYRNGTMTDLNNLLPSGTGWTLNDAVSINDGLPRAQIVGYGVHNGQTHAFLFNLCEEVCITSITAQTKAVASGDWVNLDTNTTYDGNPLRLVAHVQNMQTQAATVTVRFQDPETSTILAQQAVTVPARQTVDVSYTEDTTGQAWGPSNSPTPNHTIDTYVLAGSSTLDSRPTAVRINPRPVFLVHGLLSNASTWDAYTGSGFLTSVTPGWLGYAVPGMNTGGTGTAWQVLTETPNTIDQNAQVLANYIESMRERYDFWHVDLVAHSMGGLISRSYINSLMPDSPDGEPVVRHLVMLGTPNMGSPCADPLPIKDTAELRTDYVQNVFNPSHANTNGVVFSNLAGDKLQQTCDDPDPGDLVVPVWSAEWSLSDVYHESILHTSMTSDYNTFIDYVLPRLTTLPGSATAMSRNVSDHLATHAPSTLARVAAMSAPPLAPPQLAAQQGVTIPAGGSVDVPFSIGTASAFGVAILADSPVSSELQDPSGAATNTVAAGSPDAQQLIRSLRVANPRAGTWTVHLTNTSNASGDVDVSAWVDGSPVSLGLATGPSVANGDVPLQAKLTNGGAPVQGAQVTVSLQPLSGPATSLQLQDDGQHGDAAAADGIYGGTAPGLTMGGYYVATVKAVTPSFTRITTGGVEVSTSAPNDLVEAPPPATLAPLTSPLVAPAPAGTSLPQTKTKHPFRGMLIQTGRARLRHATAMVALKCPAADLGTCRGQVTIQMVRARRHRRSHLIVLGKAAVAVKAGATQVVAVRLGGAAIARGIRSRSLTVQVVVVAADATGLRATTERTVLLLASPVRH